jgi:hypothetical protein
MSGAAGSSQWMYAAGYTAENSLKFNDDDNSYLARTPASAGNRRTFTWSGWVKRSKIGGQQTLFLAYGAQSNLGYNPLIFTTGNQLALGGWSANWLVSTALFRDTAAWYHIVLAVDTTDGTADDRIKLYVNGTQLTDFGTRNNPSQNDDFAINNAVPHNIGSRVAYTAADDYLDGYLAEVNLVDGSALTPSSFASTGTNGIQLPKEYAGSHGTNGFYLPFKMDYEVEGFNAISWDGRSLASQDRFYVGGVGFEPDVIWTKSLESAHNHFLMTRHNGTGVLAPVRPSGADGSGMPNHAYDFLNGFNTDGYNIRGGQYASAYLARNNDMITWAWDMGGAAAGHYLIPKIFSAVGNANISTDRYKFGSSSMQFDGNGDYFTAPYNDGTFSNYGNDFTIEYWINLSGDVTTQYQHLGQQKDSNEFWRINSNNNRIEVQIEADNGNTQVNFNTTGHNTQIDTLNTWYHIALVRNGSDVALYLNGVKAGGQEYGDGESRWLEVDFYLGNFHAGGNADLEGYLDEVRFSRVARYTGNFTVASAAFSNDKDTMLLLHAEGANDSTTLTDSSGATVNTDGSGVSYVTANDTYGQSLISYFGTSGAKTLGHGLSAAPEVILVKSRSSSQEWLMYHANNTAAPQTDYLRLDTNAATADNTFWNDTAPTSSVFSVGDSRPSNSGHGDEYIALAFRSVTGYSKFGTYTGDATTDGSLSVTTGFRPAFLMVKRTDSTGGWVMVDGARNPHNPVNRYVQADVVDVEASSSLFNFTSTGFNLISNLADINADGATLVYLAFADTKEYSYYHDHSGNNNDWQSHNLHESQISLDTPNNSFATLSPTIQTGSATLADGNLYATGPGNNTGIVGGTFPPVTSGKWYFEQFVNESNDKTRVGFRTNVKAQVIDNFGFAYNIQGAAATSYNEDFANGGVAEGRADRGDIIGHAIDLDNLKYDFYKDNIRVVDYDISAASAALGYVPVFYDFSSSGANVAEAYFNFGQDSSFGANFPASGKTDGNGEGDFVYEPPSGHLAMCTNNLTDSAVTPSDAFSIVTYTGDGSSQAITGVGFQPDFVWIKKIAGGTVRNHILTDVVRGATTCLSSSLADADFDNANGLTAFGTDGFTVGSYDSVNEDSGTYIAYCWKAGSGNTAFTESGNNPAGTHNANQAAGFSIVSYTGTGAAGTVSHGLGAAPELMYIKNRDVNDAWAVYYGDNTDYMILNTTAATADSANWWNDTSPTSSVFTVATDHSVNADGEKYIAYCWRSIEGYSKIGSYTGNGNATGTFVYTGFRPAYILIKKTGAVSHWQIHDTTRDPVNVMQGQIHANATDHSVDNAAYYVDSLSNGFKLRMSHAGQNENAENYIYVAFAETEQKYSNAR